MIAGRERAMPEAKALMRREKNKEDRCLVADAAGMRMH
jgi:hypothetical protein